MRVFYTNFSVKQCLSPIVAKTTGKPLPAQLNPAGFGPIRPKLNTDGDLCHRTLEVGAVVSLKNNRILGSVYSTKFSRRGDAA